MLRKTLARLPILRHSYSFPFGSLQQCANAPPVNYLSKLKSVRMVTIKSQMRCNCELGFTSLLDEGTLLNRIERVDE